MGKRVSKRLVFSALAALVACKQPPPGAYTPAAVDTTTVPTGYTVRLQATSPEPSIALSYQGNAKDIRIVKLVGFDHSTSDPRAAATQTATNTFSVTAEAVLGFRIDEIYAEQKLASGFTQKLTCATTASLTLRFGTDVAVTCKERLDALVETSKTDLDQFYATLTPLSTMGARWLAVVKNEKGSYTVASGPGRGFYASPTALTFMTDHATIGLGETIRLAFTEVFKAAAHVQLYRIDSTCGYDLMGLRTHLLSQAYVPPAADDTSTDPIAACKQSDAATALSGKLVIVDVLVQDHALPQLTRYKGTTGALWLALTADIKGNEYIVTGADDSFYSDNDSLTYINQNAQLWLLGVARKAKGETATSTSATFEAYALSTSTEARRKPLCSYKTWEAYVEAMNKLTANTPDATVQDVRTKLAACATTADVSLYAGQSYLRKLVVKPAP